MNVWNEMYPSNLIEEVEMKLFYETYQDSRGFCLSLSESTRPQNSWISEIGLTPSNELTVSIGSPMENELLGFFWKAGEIIFRALKRMVRFIGIIEDEIMQNIKDFIPTATELKKLLK